MIDIGGGASLLIDRLLKYGYVRPAVLDVSWTALVEGEVRLAEKTSLLDRYLGDVTSFEFPRKYFLWHDRAVFHFLTELNDRKKYAGAMASSLEPGGLAIIATFSTNGPEKCSGLPVRRYDEASLVREFEDDFDSLRSLRIVHLTPWGSPQEFIYGLFRCRY